MKELFIHLGTHKTGTTAIQRVCYENREKLNDEGIDVIHHLKSLAKANFDRTYSIAEQPNVLKIIFKKYLNKDNNKIFFSYEGLSGTLYNLYDDRLNVFTSLKKALPDNVKLTFIVCFRRQDDFVQSAYTQSLHEGYDNKKHRHLLNIDYNSGIDWLKYINDIEKVFPKTKIVALPFDKYVLEQKSIYEFFGEILGSSFLKSYKIKRHENVGMNPQEVEIYNRLSYHFPDEKKIKNKIRKIIQKCSSRGILEEYNYLDEREKFEFINIYNVSNKKLASIYWKKFNINTFSSPIDNLNKSNNKENLEFNIALGLLRDIQEGNNRSKNNSIFLKIAHKIHNITGL